MFDTKVSCILSCEASGAVEGYYSKLFNKHELKYSTTEKEILALYVDFFV